MQRDEEHKAVKSKEVKEEEVVRVPLAFAMVKLMQTLPPHIMEVNLPGYEPIFPLKFEYIFYQSINNLFL